MRERDELDVMRALARDVLVWAAIGAIAGLAMGVAWWA